MFIANHPVREELVYMNLFKSIRYWVQTSGPCLKDVAPDNLRYKYSFAPIDSGHFRSSHKVYQSLGLKRKGSNTKSLWRYSSRTADQWGGREVSQYWSAVKFLPLGHQVYWVSGGGTQLRPSWRNNPRQTLSARPTSWSRSQSSSPSRPSSSNTCENIIP